MQSFALILLLLFAGGVEVARSALHGLRDCPSGPGVTDEALNECLQGALDDLRSYFEEGIPDLGLVPLDPLNVAEIGVWPPQAIADIRRDSPVQFDFHDIVAPGIANFTQGNVTLDRKAKTLKLGFQFPEFHIRTAFRITVGGTARAVRVSQEGQVLIRLINFSTIYIIYFRVEIAEFGGPTLRPIRVTWAGAYDDVELDIPEVRRSGVLGSLTLTLAKTSLTRIFKWTFTNLVPPHVGRVIEQHESFIPAISHFFAPYFVQN